MHKPFVLFSLLLVCLVVGLTCSSNGIVAGCEKQPNQATVTAEQARIEARKAHLENEARLEKERKASTERDRQEHRPIHDIR